MDNQGMISIVIRVSSDAEGLLDLVASILPQLGRRDEILIALEAVGGPAEPRPDAPQPRVNPHDIARDVAHEIARQAPFVRVFDGGDGNSTSIYEQAISACKGDYIFLAEPGDLWTPSKIADMRGAFAASESILVLHDAEILDSERQLVAPSMLALHGDTTMISENLIRDSYVGSCLAFMAPLRELALPFPPAPVRHDQWLGLVAERFGGVALITKPLIRKILEPSDGADLIPIGFLGGRDEQRRLFKILKQREREFKATLRKMKKMGISGEPED
ncbi:MAG: hypothetical protein LBH56_00185 [Coriobacteriales bacterium]|nr:hypothetical protein [Coriobacteriales bacterium]